MTFQPYGLPCQQSPTTHHAGRQPQPPPQPHVVEHTERLARRSVWPYDTALDERYPPLTGAVRDERAHCDNALYQPLASTQPVPPRPL
jgi:hypothetical protein